MAVVFTLPPEARPEFTEQHIVPVESDGSIHLNNLGFRAHSEGTGVPPPPPPPMSGLISGYEARDSLALGRYVGAGAAYYVFDEPISDVYLTVDVGIPQVSIDALLTWLDTHGGWSGGQVLGSEIIGVYSDHAYTGSVRTTNQAEADIEIVYIENDVSSYDPANWYLGEGWVSEPDGNINSEPIEFESFFTLGFHYNAGNISWQYNGSTWTNGDVDITSLTSNPYLGTGVKAIRIGYDIQVDTAPKMEIVFQNLLIGTEGFYSDDIFSNELISGDLDTIFGHDNWSDDQWTDEGYVGGAQISPPNPPYLYIGEVDI